MGTNYYHRTKLCNSCNRYDERHIGKLSCGWQFSFRGYDDIRTWQQWKEKIEKEGEIKDEYDRPVSIIEFVTLVEDSKGKQDHISWCMNKGDKWTKRHIEEAIKNQIEYNDHEGWSFSDSEFS